MAASLNQFIKLDRNFRARPFHSMSAAKQNVCLHAEPPTKMCTVSPCFPLAGFATALKATATLRDARQKSLWSFFGISSKNLPCRYEQANQSDIRIRRLQTGYRRATFTAPGKAGLDYAEGV